MASIFPVELPDRPNKNSRFALKKRLSQQLSSTRSEKALSVPVPFNHSTATTPGLPKVQSHDEHANYQTRTVRGAEWHRGGGLDASVKEQGLMPRLKHAVSSLVNSKPISERDSTLSHDNWRKSTYSEPLYVRPEPSFSIRRKPLSPQTAYMTGKRTHRSSGGLGASQFEKGRVDSSVPAAQPLSSHFSPSPQSFSHRESDRPISGPAIYMNANECRTSLPTLFELPAKSRPGMQSVHHHLHQSGLDSQHPIVIDDEDDHVRSASKTSVQKSTADLNGYAGATQASPSPQYHGLSSTSEELCMARGSNIVGSSGSSARLSFLPNATQTHGRREGRFIDSRDAVALQEQLDRNLAQQLQYEEDELYDAASSLMVPFRLDPFSRTVPLFHNGENASASSGTREAPIELDSEDEWWGTESFNTVTLTSIATSRPQTNATNLCRLSDEMDWRPSSPADYDRSQIDEDATLAQLLQDEEDQQAAPVTRECPACNEQYPICELPSLANCAHPPQTCSDCFAGWIAAQLEGSSWQNAKCPETKCKVQLNYHEIQNLASPETFSKYDTFITRAACNDDPLFRWCRACSSGQIHDSTSSTGNIFTCFSCGHKVCTIHENTWHEGETCDEYAYRTSGAKQRDQQKQEEASKKAIGKLSKKCPGKGCEWRIEKNEGCDHMTCSKCRYEFCWICLCDYDKVRRSGNAAHKKDCKYHTERLY